LGGGGGPWAPQVGRPSNFGGPPLGSTPPDASRASNAAPRRRQERNRSRRRGAVRRSLGLENTQPHPPSPRPTERPVSELVNRTLGMGRLAPGVWWGGGGGGGGGGGLAAGIDLHPKHVKPVLDSRRPADRFINLAAEGLKRRAEMSNLCDSLPFAHLERKMAWVSRFRASGGKQAGSPNRPHSWPGRRRWPRPWTPGL